METFPNARATATMQALTDTVGKQQPPWLNSRNARKRGLPYELWQPVQRGNPSSRSPRVYNRAISRTSPILTMSQERPRPSQVALRSHTPTLEVEQTENRRINQGSGPTRRSPNCLEACDQGGDLATMTGGLYEA